VGFDESELAFAPTFKVERTAGTTYQIKRIPSFVSARLEPARAVRPWWSLLLLLLGCCGVVGLC
jgi:hypothetical protein